MLSSPRKKKRSHPRLISPPFPFLFSSSHSPNIHLAPIFSTTTVDFYRRIRLNSSNRHYSHILIIFKLSSFSALGVAVPPDALKTTQTPCSALFFVYNARSTSIVVTKLKILRLFRDSTFPTARTCTPHSGHSQLVSPRHLPTDPFPACNHSVFVETHTPYLEAILLAVPVPNLVVRFRAI